MSNIFILKLYFIYTRLNKNIIKINLTRFFLPFLMWLLENLDFTYGSYLFLSLYFHWTIPVFN